MPTDIRPVTATPVESPGSTAHSPSGPAAPPFLKNAAALWGIDTVVATAVDAVADAAVYPIEIAKSGEPTAAVISPDGTRTYLHSRHRPIDEAKKTTDPVDVGSNLVFHVFGLGLGYALEQLFDRATDEAVFLVFEPDITTVRTAMEARDLSRLIASRRVLFFTQLDKADLFVRLQKFTPMIAIGTAEIAHPATVRLHGDFFEQIRAWLAEFASFSRTNLNTMVMNSRRTLENIARNLPVYVSTPGPETAAGRYAGKPAVVVSAGPSLRKNKHLLHRLVGKAVIIAVQTTLQPLLEMGIEPDFVTSLDYHDICTRFFEKLPKTLRTELVAEPKASPAIFALNPGPLTMLGNEWADSLLRELKLNKTRLPAGATVAHLAYYWAEQLQCDPILFVGQDLGFSDGLYYSPGTSYDDVWAPEFGRFCTAEMKQWEMIVRERPILRKIPDHLGRPMYTEERLFGYLQQFEREFLRTETTIIDATEGGAAKRGTVVMTLAEAIEKYCQSPLHPADKFATDGAPIHTDEEDGKSDSSASVSIGAPSVAKSSAECVAALENRRAEAREIESISRETLPLLQSIRDSIEDQPEVNRLIAKIDRLRNRMNGLGQTYDLVMQMTQSTDFERFKSDRKIAAMKLTGVDKQREQVTRDIENVRGVMAAAADFAALIDDVISRFAVTPARSKVAA
jgi:hypothetical protein